MRMNAVDAPSRVLIAEKLKVCSPFGLVLKLATGA